MPTDRQRLWVQSICGMKNDRIYRSYASAKQRCTNPNNKDYKNYFGKNIKFNITYIEFKKLWIRDKAWLLKSPTIDRIDNDGDYTYDNCQFIENSLNASKDKLKPILQFDLQGNFIKEFSSQKEASIQLQITQSSISYTCSGRYKQSKGFIFKFK